ncbi:MAG: DNA-3-methyladenine glycosylase 2 family protein [Oscillospiraceae bacterium]|nr:DNA-3-methyladenine glycosylase 2 family protein [Oscillospiraceae bacterium]
MDYTKQGKDILLKTPDLDLDETLDCGQAFRWERIGSGGDCTYHGYMLNTPLTVIAEKDYFRFSDTDEETFKNVWIPYFDLETDYSEIKERLSEDAALKKACAFAGGIRLLKQDSWEALCSFIISQNNNIPRIKGIIGRLCEMYGGFPDYTDMKDVQPEDLAPLRAGFRAKYISDCVQKLNDGVISIDEVKKLPVDEARKVLMTIKGVGPKVADCALLYGMYRIECVPMDVWMKRVMEQFYPDGFPDFVLPYAGIAQQYLFHYMRTGKAES